MTALELIELYKKLIDLEERYAAQLSQLDVKQEAQLRLDSYRKRVAELTEEDAQEKEAQFRNYAFSRFAEESKKPCPHCESGNPALCGH